jgi:transketolase
MRKEFAVELEKYMKNDSNIILLTADLGFGILDSIKENLPNQFYNLGASEQLMIGVAIGLAESGKIPVCYSISPFLILRPFELLRTYVNYESIPIKLVGSGRDKDYIHDGISHWADDLHQYLSPLENIKCHYPTDINDIDMKDFIYNKKPYYMNLAR